MPSTAELESLLTRFIGDNRDLLSKLAQIEREYKHLDAVVDRTSNIVSASFERMGSAALGAFAGITGAIGATETVFQAVKLASEAELINASFEVLLGSAEQAQKTLGELKDFALETPFQLPEIVESAKQMTAFGEEADNLVPTMRLLGEVSSGLQIPLKELSYLYGTLKAQGRAFTVDIRQFAQRGIPIYLELAKALGLVDQNARRLGKDAYQRLDKLIEQGAVDFDLVEAAFKRMTGPGGQFFGQLEKQSKTVIGLFNTMKEEIDTALKAIGNTLIEGLDLKSVIRQVSELARDVNDFLAGMSPQVKRAVLLVTALIGVFVALTAAITVAGIVFNTLFAGIGLIIGAVVTALIGGTALWVDWVGGLEKAWRKVERAVSDVWEFVKPLLRAFATMWFVSLGPIGLVLAALVSLVDSWDDVVNAVSDFYEFARPTLRALNDLLWAVRYTLRDALVSVWGEVERGARIAVGAVLALLSRITGAGLDWTTVKDGLRDLVFFFEYAFYNIDKLVDLAWEGIKYGAIALVNALINNIFAVMAVVLFPQILLVMFDGWKDLWAKCYEILAAFGQGVKKFVTEVAMGSVKAMVTAITEIKRALDNFEIPDLKAIEEKMVEQFAGLANKIGDKLGDITLTPKGIKVEGLDKMEREAARRVLEAQQAVGQGFDEFRRKKLDEWLRKDVAEAAFDVGALTLRAAMDVPRGMGEVGAEAGKAFSQEFGKNVRFDAVLANSAEAMARIAEYRTSFPEDLLRRGEFAVPNVPPLPLPTAPPPREVLRQQLDIMPREVGVRGLPANDAERETVELLKKLLDVETQIRDQPRVMAAPVGING